MLKVATIVAGSLAVVSAGPASHLKKHNPGESRSYDCPAGYTLQGKSCTAREVHAVSLICPAGTREVNGECTTFTGALKKCPEGYRASGKSCVRPIREDATPFCQDGFTMTENSTCEKLVPIPEYCPEGYRKDSGRCAVFAQKLSECPVGFTRTANGCNKVNTHPKIPTCNDDFTLESNSCVKFVDVPAFCPAGYTDGKEGCAKFANKLSECPLGFTQTGKGCKKVITHPKQPTCNADYELDGNQCTKYVPVPTFCPHGYRQGKEGCVQTANKLSECPLGFTQTGKGCKKTNTHPKVPTCQSGYELEGNMCITHIPLPAFCPAGFQQDKNGCAQYANKLSECPTGFTQSHKGCKRTTPVARIPQCPAGYDMEKNACKRVIQQPSFTVCNQGVKQGNNCITTQTASKQYLCQKGFDLINNACVSTESYDCSTQTFETICEQPAHVPTFHSKGGHLRYLGKGKKYSAPITYAKKTPQPICRQIPKTIPRTCNRQNRVAAQAVCPSGFNLNGKTCTATASTPAEVVQPAPQIITVQQEMVCPPSGCTNTETAPLNYFCPSGYTDAGERCVKTADLVQPAPRRQAVAATMVCTGGNGPSCTDIQEAPLNYYCPTGYTDAGDKCVKTAELIQPAPRKVSVAPTMICTAGDGFACTETQEAPINYYCPGDYTDAGDNCVLTAQQIQPAPRKVTVAPTMVCTGGNGPACTDIENAPLNYFCPTAYTDAGNNCIKTRAFIRPAPRTVTSPVQYQCTQGFQLAGRQCLTQDTTSFEEFCPASFVMIGDKCAKTTQHLTVCRIGQKMADGCVVTKSAPAKVTIVRTCTKGQAGC